MSDDQAKWRKRLWAYSAVRLGGLAVFGLGLAIFYTDWLREGGWPQVGAIVMILGLIDALLAPRILKKQWGKEDSESR